MANVLDKGRVVRANFGSLFDSARLAPTRVLYRADAARRPADFALAPCATEIAPHMRASAHLGCP